MNREQRELIFRMVAENPTWGAPGIHGELKILDFESLSERCCVVCERFLEIQSRRSVGRLS